MATGMTGIWLDASVGRSTSVWPNHNRTKCGVGVARSQAAHSKLTVLCAWRRQRGQDVNTAAGCRPGTWPKAEPEHTGAELCAGMADRAYQGQLHSLWSESGGTGVLAGRFARADVAGGLPCFSAGRRRPVSPLR